MSYKLEGKTVRIYIMMGVSKAVEMDDYICHVLICVKIGKMFHVICKHAICSRENYVSSAEYTTPAFFSDTASAQQGAIKTMQDMNQNYYYNIGSENKWQWIKRPSALFSLDLGHHFTLNVNHFLFHLRDRLIKAVKPICPPQVEHLIIGQPIPRNELVDEVRKVVYEWKYKERIHVFNFAPKSANHELLGSW